MKYDEYVKDLEINAPLGRQEDNDGITLLRASDVTPKPINWILKDWLAMGEFHILAGAGGTGKTTLALSIASTITTGGFFPNGVRCSTIGNVLIWSGEDTIERTLVPRLIASGADLNKCFFITEYSEKGKKRAFNPSTDFPKLNEEIKKLVKFLYSLLTQSLQQSKGK